MQKTILLLLISFLILSCGNQTQKEESTKNTNEKVSTGDDQSKIGRSNFAVIWTTPNAQLISEYSELITSEFTDLWKKDIIENAYFDNESSQETTDLYPGIACFLKAQSKKEAKSILDDLTIVKEGIASYRIYPVGTLWLDRNAEVINKRGKTKSFVSVWKTSNQNPDGQTLKAQSEEILGLWNSGAIENVYFDVQGTQTSNDKTDFVFFVNANTSGEAEAICNSLPFSKEKFATFEIYPVGIFWFGKYGVK